ncbi:MAG: alpha/beta hydrolase [Actinobacteria bacterium]|nr:alpha/beta hydrolase [Actinomycetota bacterium]
MLTAPELDAHREETRNLNQLIEAYTAVMPSFSTPEGLDELRARPSEFAGPDVEGVIERVLPGPAGPIAARVLMPAGDVRSVHLDIHGGGWCIGSAQAADYRNQQLADATGAVFVSIDYRLAPEHPFPAAPDDAEAAALWLVDHSTEEWGTAGLTIGGGSAGAHLSALTLLRLRDRHGPDAVGRFRAAILDAGLYDLGLTPSARRSQDALVIPRAVTDACLAYFTPGLDPEQRRQPEYSPLYADLADLPPALFVTGTLDPVLDDSLFLYERWRAAGNHAELAVYPDSVHGFTSMPTQLAAHARRHMIDFLRRHHAVTTT